MTRKKQKKFVADADPHGSAMMKPIRKKQVVKEAFPTFVTMETLEDLLHLHWQSLKLIKDEDEIEINFYDAVSSKDELPVTIKIKGKGVRSKYRVLNDE